MRDRLLIRHFLWRFLEHDLVSPQTDRRGVLSAVAGLVVALSLFAAILTAVPYQFFPDMPPGMAALRALDDRFLFVSTSMLVMALAAVWQWDALMLDVRDAAVLGPLPIPHWVIVRSKFAATGLLALAVLAAWNICPTLLRIAAVPAGFGLGWFAVLQLTLAHALATCAAGLFGFLAVLGVREAVWGFLGPTRFRRVSTALQGALITLLTTALLLLPGHSSRIGQRWIADDARAATMLPPLWFVGLDKALTGSVIDSVPRTRVPPYLAQDEEAATLLDRRLRSAFPQLAAVAPAALLSVGLLAVVACLWNSRRLPSVVSRPPIRRGIVSRAWKWLVPTVLARSALQEAGFFFALQAIPRCASNRIIMAAAVAVALALMIVSGLRPLPIGDDAASISVVLLATQSMVIGAILTGFRRATRLPAELRGSITFGVAWQGPAASFLVGVTRAGWIAVMLPTLTFLSIWHIVILNPRVALLHLGLGTVVGIVMMDMLFFHNRRVPFASVYSPSPDAKAAGLLYCAALLSASFTVALVERASFETPWLYAGLLATLLGISACLRRFDRVSPLAVIELDLDEQAALPTQRFSLSSYEV